MKRKSGRQGSAASMPLDKSTKFWYDFYHIKYEIDFGGITMMQQNLNWQTPPQKHSDVKALIFGIVSLVVFQLPLIPVGMGIAAVVFAAKAKKEWGSNRNFAVAGQVTGIIAICLGAISTLYWGICLLHILVLMQRDYELVPAPQNPDFFDGSDHPGQPASLVYLFKK